jgi:integrase
MQGYIKKYTAKDGKVSWHVRVELPRDPRTNKRRQLRKTARTKQEAEAMVAKLLSEIHGGTLAEASVLQQPLSEYLEEWVAKRLTGVKPNTRKRYADTIRLHINPVIGHIKLAKLTKLDVENLIINRRDQGLSAKYLELIRSVLHGAIQRAVDLDLLPRNVVKAVKLTDDDEDHEFTVWDHEQTAKFLALADEDKLAAYWRLALHTGMRKGELLALKWADLDLRQGRVMVRRTVTRDEKGQFILGTPKSKHSRRAIAISKVTNQALLVHRQCQLEQRVRLGTAYQDEDFVFADEFGKMIHPNTLSNRFHALQGRTGNPRLRVHDLRHTAATLMLANNIHPKVVSEMLGHANVMITLNLYSHVTMTLQQQAADLLEVTISEAMRRNAVDTFDVTLKHIVAADHIVA